MDAPPAEGPTVTVIDSSPTAGPFGEFEPFPEPRRLDGTYLSQPPDWAYGSYYAWPPYQYSYGYGPRFYNHYTPRLLHPYGRGARQTHRQISPLDVVRPMQRFAPGGAPVRR
jgi:hypothetical protein